jgi:hypothetical protein
MILASHRLARRSFAGGRLATTGEVCAGVLSDGVDLGDAMARIRILLTTAVLAVALSACQSATTAQDPSQTPSISAPSPTPTQTRESEPEPGPEPSAEQPEGVLGPRYVIREQVKIIECGADPTAIKIDEGIRVYHAPNGNSCPEVEVSDSVVVPLEGGEAVKDDGFRFDPAGYAGPHKRIYRLTDGRYRMYFHTRFDAKQQGIGSAVSEDGLTFTEEPGLRISAKDAGFEPSMHLSPGDIVRTSDGRYRMYFSTLGWMSTGALTSETVKSAISDDLVTWTVEEGDRLGGSSKISGGEHPSAIVNPDGSVTLFYGRNINFGLYYSTSLDGLTFEKEERLKNATLDSAFLLQPDGTLIGFIGQRDDKTGISSIDRVLLVPATD